MTLAVGVACSTRAAVKWAESAVRAQDNGLDKRFPRSPSIDKKVAVSTAAGSNLRIFLESICTCRLLRIKWGRRADGVKAVMAACLPLRWLLTRRFDHFRLARWHAAVSIDLSTSTCGRPTYYVAYWTEWTHTGHTAYTCSVLIAVDGKHNQSCGLVGDVLNCCSVNWRSTPYIDVIMMGIGSPSIVYI